MKKIGLLAGVGRLPVECAKAAKAMGIEVYAIGLLPEVDEELKAVATDYADISIGQLQAIIDCLKGNEITEVTMLGKVTKELLFGPNGMPLVMPDMRMLGLVMTLPNREDDTIMLSFVAELAKEGMKALDQTELIRPLMPLAGTITKLEPTEEQLKDMEFGLKMARMIGGIDVGQTAVVKNLAVMALEAIEGTDACIKRGGQLAKGGAVVAKAAKPKQDNRFDVPAVGTKTLESMIEVGAKALVIEAGKTLLVEKEKVVELAEANGITIVAME